MVEGVHVDREQLVFAVGFDGSNGANAALDMVLKYFLCKRSMAIAHLVHIYDDEKGYLPVAQRKSAIEKFLEVYDVTNGKRATRHMLPRLDKEKTAGRYLAEFVNDPANRVDICAMGFFGRKRRTGLDHGGHLMASNVSYVMQYSRCSVLVVKNEFLPYSFVHWLVCVDNTRASEKAMLDALCLTETDDTITVLHIAMRDEDATQVRERYSGLIKRCSEMFDRPRTVKLVVQAESANPPSDDILDYVDANNVNVICVGTDVARVRRGGSYLGSCAAKVLVCSEQPVLVAHYDSDFGEIVDVEQKLKQKVEPLPATAQTCTAAVEYSDLHKWRGSMSMGASGMMPVTF